MAAEEMPQRALERVAAGALWVLVVGLLGQLAHAVLALRLDPALAVSRLEETLSHLRWATVATSLLLCAGYGIAATSLWRLPSRLARAAAVALAIALASWAVHGALLALAPQWTPGVAAVELAEAWRWSNALAAPLGWILVLTLAHRLGGRSAVLSATAALALGAHAIASLKLSGRPDLLLTLSDWSPGHTAALGALLASLPLLAITVLLRSRDAAPTTVLADPPAWAEVGRGAQLVSVGTAVRLIVALGAGGLALLATRRPLPALHDVTVVAQALAYAAIAAGCVRLRRVPDLGDARLAATAAAVLFASLALLDLSQLGVLPRHALGASRSHAAPALAALLSATAAIGGLLLLGTAGRLARRLGETALVARSRGVAWGLAAMAVGVLVLVPNLDASLRARGAGASFAEPWVILLSSTAAVALGAIWALTAFARLFGELSDAVAARVASGGAPAARAAVKNPE